MGFSMMSLSMAPLVVPEVPSTSELAKPKTPSQGLTLVSPDSTEPWTVALTFTGKQYNTYTPAYPLS